jgi:hypothetical protein
VGSTKPKLAEGYTTAIPYRSSTAIIEHLNRLDDAPWKESGKQGKGLTTTALATRLRKFRLRPVSESTFRGYSTDRFKDVFARYLPADLSGCQGISKSGVEATSSTRQNEAPVDESKSEKTTSETGISDMLTSSRSDAGHGSAPSRENPEDRPVSEASDVYVTLPGGLVVREKALTFFGNLENRGITLSVNANGNDELVIPAALLTDADHLAIEQWRSDLLKIAAHRKSRPARSE